jgi:hypothetical protein
MKKITLGSIIFVLSFLCSSVAFGAYDSVTTQSTSIKRVKSVTATTTPITINPGSTSTFNVGRIDDAIGGSLFIRRTASTTALVTSFVIQASNDNIDYYDINLENSSNYTNIEHASTSVQNIWKSDSTNASTTSKVINISNFPVANYLRVVFSGTGATSTIYAEVTLRR